MGLWNLGSVATETLILVEGVPTNISGAALERMADRQREKVQTYTGIPIGSNSIDIQFQEAILQLTIEKTAKDMMTLGADSSESKLGDFTVKKGTGSNLEIVAKMSGEAARVELRCLGKRVTTFKANG